MSSSNASPRAAAAAILSRLDASAEAKALVAPDAEASDYVALLMEKELWTDATGFVGQWLEPYDAVAWACEAARAALGEAPPADRAALEAAERWLATRDEKDRRAAAEAAGKLGHRPAAAMAAAAAGWGGGGAAFRPPACRPGRRRRACPGRERPRRSFSRRLPQRPRCPSGSAS